VDLYSHLPRYREILAVLFKYGFADVLRLVALQHILRIEDVTIRPHPDDEILSKPLPVRLRLALEELGPTFIKFGQILSSRRDLITDDYFIELSKLQASVPPFPGNEARQIIERELGHPMHALFSDFLEKPIGSASIAQVHEAFLKDGTPVAVKVQRPEIEKTIALDVAILHDLARFAENHVPESSGLNPLGVVQEFTDTLQRELDFENEASNAERFAEQFAVHAAASEAVRRERTALMDQIRARRDQLTALQTQQHKAEVNATRLLHERQTLAERMHDDYGINLEQAGSEEQGAGSPASESGNSLPAARPPVPALDRAGKRLTRRS